MFLYFNWIIRIIKVFIFVNLYWLKPVIDYAGHQSISFSFILRFDLF